MATQLVRAKKALPILIELRKVIATRPSRRPAWFHSNFGLCTNFHDLAGRRYGRSYDLWHMCRPYIKSWPHWTGDINFIIPGTKGRSAMDAYDLAANLYDRRSDYAVLRHQLLDHLIAEAEATIKAGKK